MIEYCLFIYKYNKTKILLIIFNNLSHSMENNKRSYENIFKDLENDGKYKTSLY